MTKSEQLNSLLNEYTKEFQEEEIVPGSGNINSNIMLIGEAPGKDEVKKLMPFVGMAGKNLEEFLSILGIAREDIYITNAVKYRLSRINPISGRIVNRPALKNDIDINREYMLKEIEIVHPYYIVTLGNVPLKAVTGRYDINIGSVHGKMQLIRIHEQEYRLFPLYHPASVIYNVKLKKVYINDIETLKQTFS